MGRQWAKRETQILSVIESTSEWLATYRPSRARQCLKFQVSMCRCWRVQRHLSGKPYNIRQLRSARPFYECKVRSLIDFC
jgi:hypothetical protein